MEAQEAPSLMSIEKFKKMTKQPDITDEEALEQMDSIERLAHIIIDHMRNKGEI